MTEQNARDRAVVTDVPERDRYEIVVDGDVVGHAAYRRTGDVVTFHHTEVDPAWEGHGLGSLLIGRALDDALVAGVTVRPTCSFVAAEIGRHPDRYGTLVDRSASG